MCWDASTHGSAAKRRERSQRQPRRPTGVKGSLFIYGTLLAPEVLRLLVPRDVEQGDARLRGYVRRALHGVVFPGIVPREGETTHGVLLQGLRREEVERLDDFEGDLYQRTPCVVETERGEHQATVYVLRQEHSGRLAPRDWSFEAFMRDDFEDYLTGCRRYAETLDPLP